MALLASVGVVVLKKLISKRLKTINFRKKEGGFPPT